MIPELDILGLSFYGKMNAWESWENTCGAFPPEIWTLGWSNVHCPKQEFCISNPICELKPHREGAGLCWDRLPSNSTPK